MVPSKQIQVQDSELLSDWQRRRAEYRARKRLGGAREKDTMAKLSKFTSKLRGGAAEQPAPAAAPAAGGLEDDGYDGKVRDDLDHTLLKPAAWRVDEYLKEAEEGGDGVGLAELRAHRLHFVTVRRRFLCV